MALSVTEISNELSPQAYIRFLDEVARIPTYKAPINGDQTRLAFEFMEDTGLRVTEMLHVRKQDIDLRTRILTVIHPKVESRCKCSVWRNRNQYTRAMVLESAEKDCPKCHGKGKWKKPQFTSITPRIREKMAEYCESVQDELLWPTTRKTMWKWCKAAGVNAGVDISTQLDEQRIDGMYNHLFRRLCAKRMMRDARDDAYARALQDRKMRHGPGTMGDRYTKVDINYLVNWERGAY